MYYKLTRRSISGMVSVIFLLSIMVTSSVFADISVVANKSLASDSITQKEAKKIWLGKIKALNGVTLKVSDLPKGNATRDYFYKNVVKKSERKVKATWARIVFAAKGTPPKVFGSDAEVLSWIASTPGAVGYVSSAAVDDSVKVLLVHK